MYHKHNLWAIKAKNDCLSLLPPLKKPVWEPKSTASTKKLAKFSPTNVIKKPLANKQAKTHQAQGKYYMGDCIDNIGWKI